AVSLLGGTTCRSAWGRLGVNSLIRRALTCLVACCQSAGGGIRTHTGVAPRRILSPLRLPFRHTGAAWGGSQRIAHTTCDPFIVMKVREESRVQGSVRIHFGKGIGAVEAVSTRAGMSRLDVQAMAFP